MAGYRWFDGEGRELELYVYNSALWLEIDDGHQYEGVPRQLFVMKSLSDLSSLIDTLQVIEAEIRKEVCGDGVDREGQGVFVVIGAGGGNGE